MASDIQRKMWIMNFERLIVHASNHNWCWSLGCSTCGCMTLRTALRRVHQLPLNLEEYSQRSNRTYSSSLRTDIFDAKDLDFERLLYQAKFPDWLGVLGVFIYESQEVDKNSDWPLVAYRWLESISALFEKYGAAEPKFVLYSRKQENCFSWRELTILERDIIELVDQHMSQASFMLP